MFPCQPFPSRDDGVAVDRVVFYKPSPAAAGICGNQRGAGSAKDIQDSLAVLGTVAYRIRDQRCRLHSRVHRLILKAVRAYAADPRIIPDIGPVPAGVSEAKGIGVRRGADLKDKDQFVFGAIECPHAAVGLVPNPHILQFREGGFASLQQFPHVPPVHADECYRAVPADGGSQ